MTIPLLDHRLISEYSDIIEHAGRSSPLSGSLTIQLHYIPSPSLLLFPVVFSYTSCVGQGLPWLIIMDVWVVWSMQGEPVCSANIAVLSLMKCPVVLTVLDIA